MPECLLSSTREKGWKSSILVSCLFWKQMFCFPNINRLNVMIDWKNKYSRTNVPAKSKLKHPPRAYPGHWTFFPACEGEGGGALMITTHRGWGIWLLALISCYESRWFHVDFDKSWWRWQIQTLMNSKEKIAYSKQIGWKPKAYTSCVLFFKAFMKDLYL